MTKQPLDSENASLSPMVHWKNVEHPVGIRIELVAHEVEKCCWFMKHALENVVINGKSLEATRATSWPKMSGSEIKKGRSTI